MAAVITGLMVGAAGTMMIVVMGGPEYAAFGFGWLAFLITMLHYK
jgi:hypothetical protein